MAATYEIRGLGVELAGRHVLDEVSFDVRVGEFVSIMGRSGVGKTTLLRALAGLVTPTAGSVALFEGQTFTEPPDGASLVFQDYARSLLPWRTVARNVALPLERALGKAERNSRVAEALELVGLSDRAAARPFEMSGGMQQRVQLARALASRPRVLLMDEPFGALDALTKAVLEDELLDVVATTGTTVVFVTHDIDEAVYLSDRVLVLDGQPATVRTETVVGCGRPRSRLETRQSSAFLAARQELHEVIFGPE